MHYINATQYFRSLDCQKHLNTTIYKADNVELEKDKCVNFRMGNFVGGYEIKEDNKILKIKLFEDAMGICKDPLTKWDILNSTNCFNINFQGRNDSFKIEVYDRQFNSSASMMHISILILFLMFLIREEVYF